MRQPTHQPMHQPMHQLMPQPMSLLTCPPMSWKVLS
jgi:hypothetical protein